MTKETQTEKVVKKEYKKHDTQLFVVIMLDDI